MYNMKIRKGIIIMYDNEQNRYDDSFSSEYREEHTEGRPQEPVNQGAELQIHGSQPSGSAQGGWSSQSYTESRMEPGYQAYQSDWNAQGSQEQQKEQQFGTSHYANRVNMSHIPQERPRKNGNLAGKIAGVTAAAMLFGVVAGGTMFGINTAGRYVMEQISPEEETQAPVQVTVGNAGTDNPTAPAVSGLTQTVLMDVSPIVKMAMPSVVAINNTMVVEQQLWFGPTQRVEVPSSGSGIIVGQNEEELLIVTNNHVVEDSKELSVTFINNASVNAGIKGTDSESDLAVIAVPVKDIPSDTMSQIKVAVLGDSDALEVGQGVIAIGNALGYGQSVTVGYVSALDREVKAENDTSRNLLQTDAAINPGNSGGALLNMKGEVVGINAAKYSSTEVEGMGYAIPVSKVQDIINELMNKKTRVTVEETKQGYLGIQGQNIDDTAATMYDMPRGIYVYKITEDGAAARSDLREKDIITKFDGQTVRTMADLKEMLTYYEGGSTVNLTVQSLENGVYNERIVEVTLGVRPQAGTN